MRALNHVLSAFAGGMLVSSWLPQLETPMLRLTFAAASAGAALLPDGNTSASTVAHIGGTPTRWIADRIGHVCHRVYRATATPADPQRRDGHRGLTHTAVYALGCGAGAAVFGLLGGGLVIAVMLVVLVALALRPVPGRRRGRTLQRLLVALVTAVTVVVCLPLLVPPGTTGAVVFGGAVGLGMLLAMLGDLITDSGVPLLWPLKIGGKRWFRFRLPRRWAPKTGEPWEYLAGLLFAALGVLQVLALLPA